MKKVYKYNLEVTASQRITMPANAELLCVQLQMGMPCLWALVDTEAPLVERIFRTVGIGETMSDSDKGDYAGTYQMQNGTLVFHVFDMFHLTE